MPIWQKLPKHEKFIKALEDNKKHKDIVLVCNLENRIKMGYIKILLQYVIVREFFYLSISASNRENLKNYERKNFF